MKRADRAIGAAWPGRVGGDYTREMQWAAGELETIAAEMQKRGLDPTEQSRTYRCLGSVYSDLAPALGRGMLAKAKEAYLNSESLLPARSDRMERAKLDFDYANTLRQIDPNDRGQLKEAKRRLLSARGVFALHAPEYLPRVDTALQSVEGLLRLAPMATALARDVAEMQALERQLKEGKNVGDVAGKMRQATKRRGGAAGMVGQARSIAEGLSEEQRTTPQFEVLQQQLDALTKKVLGRASPQAGADEGKLFASLEERLKAEASRGTVANGRAETLQEALEQFATNLPGDEDDLDTMRAKLGAMRRATEGMFEAAHYQSHGIPRPPVGSRAAELVELHWQLRRYLLEEMNRPNKGDEESKEALQLCTRASKADKRIYQAGHDDAMAKQVEKEVLRPLALDVRTFSARMHSMPARPIWRGGRTPTDASALFLSGPARLRGAVTDACSQLGLQVMSDPLGGSYAAARWKQLQKAVTAVFDLRSAEGVALAAVTYELGIALTIGKPVVILVAPEQGLPFDVDVEPVVLSGGDSDASRLASAIDRAVYSVYPESQEAAHVDTLEYLLAHYQRPQESEYVDQTLQMLIEMRKRPDPLAVTGAMVTFFDFMNDGKTTVIQPVWTPAYPMASGPRLFHVMPFRPPWADAVSRITRQSSEAAGLTYVRGDEVDEPNVIRSIWEELARASHVVVDLTGFNANVTLELGIAHTLGRDLLLVGQPRTVDTLFPSIRKLRVKEYDLQRLEASLGAAMSRFISLERVTSCRGVSH